MRKYNSDDLKEVFRNTEEVCELVLDSAQTPEELDERWREMTTYLVLLEKRGKQKYEENVIKNKQ